MIAYWVFGRERLEAALGDNAGQVRDFDLGEGVMLALQSADAAAREWALRFNVDWDRISGKPFVLRESKAQIVRDFLESQAAIDNKLCVERPDAPKVSA